MKLSPQIDSIRRKFLALAPFINERSRRHWAAVEAVELGWGGVSSVAIATGMSRTTITAGIAELRANHIAPNGIEPNGTRVRRPGGGRKRALETTPALRAALEAMFEPAGGEGDSSVFRWTCKSTRALVKGLQLQGLNISERTVASILRDLGFTLQPSRKTRLGIVAPEQRTERLHKFQGELTSMLTEGQPVVLLQMRCRARAGLAADEGDFVNRTLGDGIEGIAEINGLALGSGWQEGCLDNETANFAARTVGRWWGAMGADRFPRAKSLMIVEPCHDGQRSLSWCAALEDLAVRTGLNLRVRRLPPCTSRWSNIDQVLACYLVEKLRGRRRVRRQAIVKLVTHSSSGQVLERATLDFVDSESSNRTHDLERVQKVLIETDDDWSFSVSPRF